MASYDRTQKPTNYSKGEAGGRTNQYFGMYIGFVKANEDAHRMGRLKVWIPEFGSAEKDSDGWITVNYCSPFGGVTDGVYLGKGSDKVEEYKFAQQSYGMWFVPPDLNNQVGVMFANGDPVRGFWFGSVFNQFMNQMVPGTAAGRNYEFNEDVPTTEYNKYETKRVNPNDATRPYHREHTEGLVKSGLIKDKIRGVTSSSARRESPSQVYGINTPGPVDPQRTGHRRGGSHLYFDDLEGNEHISLRTRSGAGIRIDESNGIIYVSNRDGTGWVEISESGQVQIYGKGDVSVRTEGDFNVRADRDINMEAGRNVHLKAVQSYKAPSDPLLSSEILDDDAGEGGHIKIQALSDVDVTVQENYRMNVLDGNYDLKVGGQITESSVGEMNIKSANYEMEYSGNIYTKGTIHADGTISSGGDVVSSKQSLDALFNHVHAQGSYNVPGHGAVVGDSSPFGAGGSATSATGIEADVSLLPPLYEKTNVYHDSDVLTFDKETQTIQTVVSKLMTAEPCPDHENKGDA